MNTLWHEIRALLAEQCLRAAAFLMPVTHRDAPPFAAALEAFIETEREERELQQSHIVLGPDPNMTREQAEARMEAMGLGSITEWEG